MCYSPNIPTRAVGPTLSHWRNDVRQKVATGWRPLRLQRVLLFVTLQVICTPEIKRRTLRSDKRKRPSLTMRRRLECLTFTIKMKPLLKGTWSSQGKLFINNFARSVTIHAPYIITYVVSRPRITGAPEYSRLCVPWRLGFWMVHRLETGITRSTASSVNVLVNEWLWNFLFNQRDPNSKE